MCGSGTLNVEAAIIGIDSIGIEKSPFCTLMSRVKYESLKTNKHILSMALSNMTDNYRILRGGKRISDKFDLEHDFNLSKAITLLSFLDTILWMFYGKRVEYGKIILKRVERKKSAFCQTLL